MKRFVVVTLGLVLVAGVVAPVALAEEKQEQKQQKGFGDPTPLWWARLMNDKGKTKEVYVNAPNSAKARSQILTGNQGWEIIAGPEEKK